MIFVGIEYSGTHTVELFPCAGIIVANDMILKLMKGARIKKLGEHCWERTTHDNGVDRTDKIFIANCKDDIKLLVDIQEKNGEITELIRTRNARIIKAGYGS